MAGQLYTIKKIIIKRMIKYIAIREQTGEMSSKSSNIPINFFNILNFTLITHNISQNDLLNSLIKSDFMAFSLGFGKGKTIPPSHYHKLTKNKIV